MKGRLGEDTFTRLDPVGVRTGPGRPPVSAGEAFPYDRDIDPEDMDLLGNDGPDQGHLHGPLNRSAWDELEEAMGTPMFLQKAYTSQRGNPVANSAVGWGKMPSHEWDKDEKEAEVEFYGESEEVPEEPVPPGFFSPSNAEREREVIPLSFAVSEEYSEIWPEPSVGNDSLRPEFSVWPFLEKYLAKIVPKT